MDRQFSYEPARKYGGQVGLKASFINAIHIGANAEIRFGQPVREQAPEMLSSTDAHHTVLGSQERMPRQDFEVVKPAVLNH
jgi:hypothetical protein